MMYQIIRQSSRFAPGNCTITRQRVIKNRATRTDVDAILALPEKYPGERDEAIDELESMGCAGYAGYMIFELPK